MKKIFILLLIILYIANCKSTNKIFNKLDKEKVQYNKYIDDYKNFKYKNSTLDFIMEFDNEWIIITKFEQFNDLQKKYAKLFSTEYGEVLFFGFNETKKIGIRCTCEVIGLDNKKYLEKIKIVSNNEIAKYKIISLKEEEIILKNIKAYSYIFETNINSNNIFIFDSILFQNENNNFKVDIWIEKDNYETHMEYIKSIFNTIDFDLKSEFIKTDDNTPDITKENKVLNRILNKFIKNLTNN